MTKTEIDSFKKESVSFNLLKCLWILIKSEMVSRQRQSLLRPRIINHFIKCVCIELTSSSSSSTAVYDKNRRNSFEKWICKCRPVSVFKMKKKNQTSECESECEVNLSWCQFSVRFSEIDYMNHHFPLKTRTNWFWTIFSKLMMNRWSEFRQCHLCFATRCLKV